MNKIKELFELLTRDIDKIFDNHNDNMCDDYLFGFTSSFKDTFDLTTHIFLSTDAKKNYCFYRVEYNGDLKHSLLFDSTGKILKYDSHSKMVNSGYYIDTNGNKKEEDLDYWYTNINYEFKKNLSNIEFTQEEICAHYLKNKYNGDKHPIPLRYCHYFGKMDIHLISQLESRTRNDFNSNTNTCMNCKKETVLDKSHLVSAKNIRNLGDNVFYPSHFIEDLNYKPITYMTTISQTSGNDQNRNFKISAFCRTCEGLFQKSDNNEFVEIQEISQEIIKKSFGVYYREVMFNEKLFENINNETDISDNNKKILINKITKERNVNKSAVLKKYINNFRLKDCLPIKEYSFVFELRGKPFLESCSLSFDSDNIFYLIIITNKDKKIFINIITDFNNNKFVFKDMRKIDPVSIVYAAITLNKYTFYSKNFYNMVKPLAENMIYDYYNNDCESSLSNPIIIPKSNYVKELKEILTNFMNLN